jgi:hypothetical protein
MRRYWNKFLNWLIPNRREQLLTEMMLRDQELGLYNLDLNKLEQKLDDALSNETSESLTNWLEEKRMTNNKAREYTSPLIEELLNEVTPEEMERTDIEMENIVREFDNSKLNYIANTLKETASRMEYIGDISDLGNEIGYTVGSVYKDMTEEDIEDFISGFIHGISLTNGTH